MVQIHCWFLTITSLDSYLIIYHDTRSKHQAKVQVFSEKSLTVFPSNDADSFFDMHETRNSVLVTENNHHCLCLGLWHVCFFGVGDADACFGHKPVLTSTGFHSHFCPTVHLTWCYCVASATFCRSCGRMKTWLCKYYHCFTSEAIFASTAHKMKPHMCHNAWLLIYCVLPTQINNCVAILGTCHT